eukprot:747125-Hanusia_phi.AAC.3
MYCPQGTGSVLLTLRPALMVGRAGAPSGVKCPAGSWCQGAAAAKQPCQAAPGFYCPEGAAALAVLGWEVSWRLDRSDPQRQGHYCMGGAAPPQPCRAGLTSRVDVGTADAPQSLDSTARRARPAQTALSAHQDISVLATIAWLSPVLL